MAEENPMSQKMVRNCVTLCMTLALLLVLVPGCTHTKSNKVLLILSEQSDLNTDPASMQMMLDQENKVMTDMLTKAGYKVITASDSGKPFTLAGYTLKPDMKISDVKVDDYAGFIIPCMARSTTLALSSELKALLTKAAEKNINIAAEMGGVYVLKEAGILNGKKFAMVADNKGDFPNSIFAGEGVVQDGNIITGGICPFIAQARSKKSTTVDLTQKFIDALGSR
jgi:transcriptional regulator GlxA family with amidase domain